MLEKIIKKDNNQELEKILEQKKIDEQARNLLQGILYKVEVSYKDYKTVKVKQETETKYVEKILKNIQQKCNKINIAKPSKKLADEKIQTELEKNKYYVGNEEIVSYPIEEKLLYAIEKKSNNPKILNNKYEEATIAISDFINTGKNIDKTEVIRDFNGWSWATIKNEIENIEVNLIYQILQITLGEEFLENWCEDKDGIIDYLELFSEEMTSKFGEKISNEQKELLIELSIINTIQHNLEFANIINEKIKQLQEQIEQYEDTKTKIKQITNHKKELLKDLNKLDVILGQDDNLKAEYEKRNEEAPINKKIFNIRALKQLLNDQKQEILEEIEKDNYLLNPSNYIKEKNKLIEQKEKLENAYSKQEEIEKKVIQFIKNFLKCFNKIIKDANDEEIVKLIYKFRYFMLLPFNKEKSIKDIKRLSKNIKETEEILVKRAIEKKIITNVPFEIMTHVFETRIITLEELYYKITSKSEKQYVQIFDENVSEEKFEIESIEKTKINKKIKIFI